MPALPVSCWLPTRTVAGDAGALAAGAAGCAGELAAAPAGADALAAAEPAGALAAAGWVLAAGGVLHAENIPATTITRPVIRRNILWTPLAAQRAIPVDSTGWRDRPRYRRYLELAYDGSPTGGCGAR